MVVLIRLIDAVQIDTTSLKARSPRHCRHYYRYPINCCVLYSWSSLVCESERGYVLLRCICATVLKSPPSAATKLRMAEERGCGLPVLVTAPAAAAAGVLCWLPVPSLPLCPRPRLPRPLR